MAKRPNYTFEDWANDDIKGFDTFEAMEYFEFNNFLLPASRRFFYGDGIPFPVTPEDGYFPLILLECGLLTQQEFDKIEEAQKEAYWLVVSFFAEEAKTKLSKRLEQSPDPVRFLKQRKKVIDGIFDKANSEDLEKALAREWNRKFISAKRYNEIIERDKKNLPQEYIYEKVEDHKFQKDDVFKLTVLHEELLTLEEHLSNIQQDHEDGTSKLIQEFVTNFSRGTKYKPDVISAYLKSWESLKGHTNKQRHLAKQHTKELCENFASNVPADGTLLNWESKWSDFKEARNI